MPRIGAAALVVLVIFALAGRAPAAWECRTEHFRVISEPGPEVAQTAAARLEAVRRNLSSLGLPPPERSAPVLVLVFADRGSLEPYASADSRGPALTRGLSLIGQERLWIAVGWETPRGMLSNLAHEYAHLVRQDSSDPLWFREGLAEYVARLPLGGTNQAASGQYHPRLLREHTWTGWREFLAADRMSAAFARPNFYSQAWLAVHWLAARGSGIGQAQPAELESLVRAHGSEWVDAQLRAYLEELAPESPAHQQDMPESAESAGWAQPLEVRLAQGWEFPYWKAEFHRELDHWGLAQPALEALEWEYPEVPEPSAALGALAIAQGRYELAEQKLRAAVQKGSRSPHTHHRFSLMLLRPPESGRKEAGGADPAAAADRVARAVWHARQARIADPREPRYLLGEAQALLVAGHWDSAARLLLELQNDFPGWSERSQVEFAELLRRRQQVVRNVPPPRMASNTPLSGGTAAPLPALVAGWLSPAPPHVPKPGPPPRAETKLIWPPPGTVLLYGYINGVECRESEKIVTVRTPRFTIELRESAASPAKLYHPPSRWTELPCGLRGREVNVVYRPLPAGGEVRGELVAVVF